MGKGMKMGVFLLANEEHLSIIIDPIPLIVECTIPNLFDLVSNHCTDGRIFHAFQSHISPLIRLYRYMFARLDHLVLKSKRSLRFFQDIRDEFTYAF